MINTDFDIKSQLPGISWPGIPGPDIALLLSLVAQLEKTQWLQPDALREKQFEQLKLLLKHVWQTIPYYRNRLSICGFSPDNFPVSLDEWQKVPVLTREEVQEAGKELQSSTLPKGHDLGFSLKTSGATGRPITISRNNIDKLFWHALTLRDHIWHNRNASGATAIIRKLDKPETAPPPHGRRYPTWGPPIEFVFHTGPSYLLDLGTTPVKTQAEWLKEINPEIILTYPSNAAALARYFIDKKLILPKLNEVRTLSETLTDETRAICRNAWGCEIKDMYSANEVGYIALQCPNNEHYHVQSEALFVEVLDKDNRPCSPGEIGRVIATSLHSFASPLIRYEIGDYAEVGEPCECGRGLPVLNRIMGRSRNMLTLPNGNLIWPVVRPSRYSDVAPVRQVQMIQKSLKLIQVRLVVSETLDQATKDHLTKEIHESLNYPFELDYKYLDEIPRTAGGKFEEFVSEII